MSSAHDFEPPAYVPTSSVRKPIVAGRKIHDSAAIYRCVPDLREAQQEHFVVLSLDVRHKIISRRTTAIGTLTGVEVHPREVFRAAIADGAAAVVLVHNHPSGDPSPSLQDIELTARLREVGTLVGIPVLDHVIVSANGFTSLAERGWV